VRPAVAPFVGPALLAHRHHSIGRRLSSSDAPCADAPARREATSSSYRSIAELSCGTSDAQCRSLKEKDSWSRLALYSAFQVWDETFPTANLVGSRFPSSGTPRHHSTERACSWHCMPSFALRWLEVRSRWDCTPYHLVAALSVAI
jgi:hypothetical protein